MKPTSIGQSFVTIVQDASIRPTDGGARVSVAVPMSLKPITNYRQLSRFSDICGAPFDLEATPNFKARLEEAGFDWPPPTILDYPLKSW